MHEFVVRLYFMVGLKLIKTQMMIFFTAKNILTVIVYGYRNDVNFKKSSSLGVPGLQGSYSDSCIWLHEVFIFERLKYLWNKCESDLLYNKASDFIRRVFTKIFRFSMISSFSWAVLFLKFKIWTAPKRNSPCIGSPAEYPSDYVETEYGAKNSTRSCWKTYQTTDH